VVLPVASTAPLVAIVFESSCWGDAMTAPLRPPVYEQYMVREVSGSFPWEVSIKEVKISKVVLGEGFFGTVYKAKWRDTMTVVSCF